MYGYRPVGKFLAMLGLVLIAGCNAGNGSDSYTELSVTGGGNQVSVSNPGSFRMRLPNNVSAIDVRFTQPAGSLQLRSGKPNDSITGSMTNAAIAAESDTTGTILSIGIRGTAEPSAKVDLRLPASPKLTLHLDQGNGNLMTDLAEFKGGRVVLSGHSGNVTLVLSGSTNQEIEIQQGEGAITIQAPASAALVVRGDGTPVKIPQSFRQVADREFASPSYQDRTLATVINVQGFDGTVEVRVQ